MLRPGGHLQQPSESRLADLYEAEHDTLSLVYDRVSAPAWASRGAGAAGHMVGHAEARCALTTGMAFAPEAGSPAPQQGSRRPIT